LALLSEVCPYLLSTVGKLWLTYAKYSTWQQSWGANLSEGYHQPLARVNTLENLVIKAMLWQILKLGQSSGKSRNFGRSLANLVLWKRSGKYRN
jgi:hypothetical protein